jgi:hypothetical protein
MNGNLLLPANLAVTTLITDTDYLLKLELLYVSIS